MRLLLGSIFLFFGSLAPTVANAATTWSNSTVNYISCFANGVCSVSLVSTGPSVSGTCSGTGTLSSFYVNSDSAAGQAQLKLLAAAKAGMWTVTLTGFATPACEYSGAGSLQEDLYQVQTH